MKRFLSLTAALLLCLGLLGCGGSTSSEPTPTPAPKDYSQILHDARDSEFNQYYMIIAPGREEGVKYQAIDGVASEYTAEQLESFAADFVLPIFGLTEDMAEDYAVSVSVMNTQCYGVAIVKPAEGQQDAVRQAMEDYVQAQQSAFEFYLADQYDIALEATVTVADSGEVVLVCCKDGDTVRSNILTALAA